MTLLPVSPARAALVAAIADPALDIDAEAADRAAAALFADLSGSVSWLAEVALFVDESSFHCRDAVLVFGAEFEGGPVVLVCKWDGAVELTT